MRIFIITLGSRGDVQPYVALGKGLKAAGHAVTLCTAQRFEGWIRQHGLDYGHMNDDVLALLDSDAGREVMEDVDGLWSAMLAFRRMSGRVGPAQRRLFEDGFRAAVAAAPELIVFHPKAYAGPYFAEKLQVPAVLVSPLPIQYVPSGEQPAFGFPALPLGPVYNRATARFLVWSLMAYVRKYIDAFRAEQGLTGERPDFLHAGAGQRTVAIHTYSPALAPVPSDLPAGAHVTGTLFLDGEGGPDWQPPPALAAFLAQGPPPVYVGFGSMVGRQRGRLTRLVLEATERAGVRAVVARGWGGMAGDALPAHVVGLDEAPHGWLFPRMAAVVHHGGAGTTASGLRAGRPTVVCPFFGDQPFWGARVEALGVGVRTRKQKHVTAAELAEAITRVTADAAMAERATALGARLRSEDGLAKTIACIERAAAPG